MMQPYQQLEAAWAEFNDLDPSGMVACSSGTAALHLAMEAFQLSPGSEVIVPDFTMIACARAVALASLENVFIDCGDDLLLDHRLLGNVANPSAIIAVHVYGRRCSMDQIAARAGEAGCFIVEDSAEAHGVRPHPRTDAMCVSFYKNKIIAGQEGGAVWFRNQEHAELARSLRSLGFTASHDFYHVPRGHNYRMSNAHAELVLESLAKYETNLNQRREIEAWYDAACPDEWRMPPRDAPWVYDLRLRGHADKLDSVVRTLRESGIEARHGFKPMSWQKEFSRCRLVKGERHVAGLAAREVMYLPLTPGLSRERATAAVRMIGFATQSHSVTT